MKLFLALSLLLFSNIVFANGFVCKEDARPGEGSYTLVSLRELNGKYSMYYLELADVGRRVEREEQILFQNAQCIFSLGEKFSGACQDTNGKVVARFGIMAGKMVINTEAKQVSFNLKDCYKN